METIARDFRACPVTWQNLSDWRRGGYQEWLAIRDLLFQSAIRNPQSKEAAVAGQPPIVPDCA